MAGWTRLYWALPGQGLSFGYTQIEVEAPCRLIRMNDKMKEEKFVLPFFAEGAGHGGNIDGEIYISYRNMTCFHLGLGEAYL